MSKTVLPNRRHVVHIKRAAMGFVFHFSIGYDPRTGKICEVWVNGGKEGALLRETMFTVARLVSLALQHGVSVQALVDVMSDSSTVETVPGILAQIMKEELKLNEQRIQPISDETHGDQPLAVLADSVRVYPWGFYKCPSSADR